MVYLLNALIFHLDLICAGAQNKRVSVLLKHLLNYSSLLTKAGIVRVLFAISILVILS